MVRLMMAARPSAGSTGKKRGSEREEPRLGGNDGDDAEGREALRQLVEANTGSPEEGGMRYRCQATQMVAASEALSTVDPRVYAHEFTSGNVRLGRFARVMARAVVMQTAHHLHKRVPTVEGLEAPSHRRPSNLASFPVSGCG